MICNRRFSLPAAFVIFMLTAASAHAASTIDPHAIFAAMKAASGGARWDDVAEIDFRATLSQGGLKGQMIVHRELRTGRSAVSFNLGTTHGGNGYDGKVAWFRDEKGLVTPRSSARARRRAMTNAYIVRNGWFKSAHDDPAAMRYLGDRRDGGRRFQLIEITPARGIAVEVWIDAHSHLLARVHKPGDAGKTVTTYYSDYRDVDGLRLPFMLRMSHGTAQYDSVIRIDRWRVRNRAVAANFVRPPSRVSDARIVGGGASAEVPFESYASLILVKVSINGGAPLPFILDTGGLNLLTPAAAGKLGIRGQGDLPVHGVGGKTQSLRIAQVKTYRLGDVQLDDQQFLIIKLPELLTYRGHKTPIAGLIGYEVLRRFVTRIDYGRDRLTLTPVGEFHYRGDGHEVPLTFAGRTPQVRARVNGVTGVFKLDTGDSGGLTLFAAFARAHDIALAGRVSTAIAAGVGGSVESRSGRVNGFAIGGFELSHPVADLVDPRAGAFASKVLAGNIGRDILSRFTLTLDYERQRLYLEPDERFAEPFRNESSRSGLHLNRLDPDTLIVAVVDGGSAAQAAGLRAGDKVVALDGIEASAMGLDAIKRQLRRPPNDRLTVTAMLNGERHDLTMALPREAGS